MRLPLGVLRFLARQRHRLPERIVREAVELAALLPVASPVLTLPTVRRVLVVAPHPDDESIGCGGTIARLTASGCDVEVVVITDGEATIGASDVDGEGSVAARRRREVRMACDRLGTSPPIHLHLPDGAVAAAVEDLATALGHELARSGPELLLVPWALEAHPDHRAVIAALARLGPRRCELWGYEAHTPIPLPDRVIDITEVVERKRAALLAHTTASRAFDLEASLGLARWRSLATRAGTGAAEAFLTMRWEDLPDHAERAEHAWSAL